MNFKKLILPFFLLSFFVQINRVSAQSAPAKQDVVYLKNGSVIKGSLTEIIPGKILKIETVGGSMFVFEMGKVKKITLGNNDVINQNQQFSRSNTKTKSSRTSSNSQQQEQQSQQQPRSQLSQNRSNFKNPTTAEILGIVITGGGHIYAGETGKGLLLLGTAVAAPVVGYSLSTWDDMTPYYIGLGVTAVSWIYSIVDASNAARRANRRHNGLALSNSVQLNPTYLTTRTKSGYGLSMKIEF